VTENRANAPDERCAGDVANKSESGPALRDSGRPPSRYTPYDAHFWWRSDLGGVFARFPFPHGANPPVIYGSTRCFFTKPISRSCSGESHGPCELQSLLSHAVQSLKISSHLNWLGT
jgi:hypothetical protein